MKTRVVHVNDQIPGAVYIGRAVPRKGLKESAWANPYTIGKHGTRAEVIELYRGLILTLYADYTPSVRIAQRNALRELVGKPLACWCRHDGEERTPENACHGDVLCDLLEELGLESEATND